MINNTKKNTIKLTRHTGKEIGIEVRKSHFLIGTDSIDKFSYNKSFRT
jgi:hypothetical protein